MSPKRIENCQKPCKISNPLSWAKADWPHHDKFKNQFQDHLQTVRTRSTLWVFSIFAALCWEIGCQWLKIISVGLISEKCFRCVVHEHSLKMVKKKRINIFYLTYYKSNGTIREKISQEKNKSLYKIRRDVACLNQFCVHESQRVIPCL